MVKLLILSPSPAEKKMLELAFELNGFSIVSEKPDIILTDIILNTKEQWGVATQVCKQKTAKKVLILPHGYNPNKLPPSCKNADLVIKRPYELMDMVKKVKT